MPLTRTTRRVLPPAKGTCRWVCQLTDAHAGVLTINGTVYTLERHDTGYALTKQDGTVYDLPLTLDSCDCPDSCFRLERSAGLCKHANAARAALRAIDWDIPAAKCVPAERLGDRSYGPNGSVKTIGGAYAGD